MLYIINFQHNLGIFIKESLVFIANDSFFYYTKKVISGNVFKIKEGKKEIWEHWCFIISNELKSEALETLVEEGLAREIFFIFEKDSEYFTVGFGEFEKKISLTNTEKEVNKKHKEKKKECLEYIGPISVLYDLSV